MEQHTLKTIKQLFEYQHLLLDTSGGQSLKNHILMMFIFFNTSVHLIFLAA